MVIGAIDLVGEALARWGVMEPEGCMGIVMDMRLFFRVLSVAVWDLTRDWREDELLDLVRVSVGLRGLLVNSDGLARISIESFEVIMACTSTAPGM